MSRTGRHNYSFRNIDPIQTGRLTATPNAAEEARCALDESWEIVAKETDSRLVRYFTGDLCRFLGDAFGVYLRVRRVSDPREALKSPHHKIFLFDAADVPDSPLESDMKAAFHITVTPETITIIGRTERGTAQGAYYLEDHMKLRGEARVREECQEHAPLFSPRMTHSGTELDTFPDTFLEACAHSGMDAIMVFVGHVDTCLHGFPDPDALWAGSGIGYCDFNNLIWRAEGYGLDVYIYSELKCDVHPRDPGAKEYYDASFGAFFRNCPGLKGVIFVGECFEFPSLDPHTCGIRTQLKPKGDTRPSPGWYPCFDYPELLQMVQSVVYPHNPDADIVFWSYNWGWAPKDARLELIRNLPKGITLQVTFDMWQQFADEKGRTYKIDDYSISFPGPSQVFIDEAEEAKRCGVRLYSMTNTGGRTWDNGVTPYLPVPQQWQKRYEGLRQAHEAYGLCGLMENHHFGWLPSFLTLFAKNAYMTNAIPDEDMLRRIAARDFGAEADKALAAWELFSEGLRSVIAANCDQYGPYRCGPTYPLLFDQTQAEIEPDMPSVPWATHAKFGIWFPMYPENIFEKTDFTMLRYERVQKTMECFRKGHGLLCEAVRSIGAEKGSEPSCQAAVAGFLHSSYVTAYHVMRWTIAKVLLRAVRTGALPEGADVFFDALGLKDRTEAALTAVLRDTARAETENVSRAVAYQLEDSRIGFEPTMEYTFDPEFAAWKNGVTEESLKRLDAYLTK